MRKEIYPDHGRLRKVPEMTRKTRVYARVARVMFSLELVENGEREKEREKGGSMEAEGGCL